MIVHTRSSASRSETTVTQTVVAAVSDAEDCDLLALPPLWDVIDSEAMDVLFAPTRTATPRSGRLEFQYAGYAVDVEIDTDSTVTVSVEALADGDGSIETR
ncbi:HalOD1 output domain-containing protein [Natronolimnohabitans innermongolicus]|uniref:Halobacterial output domain-containing protein n=1 Tax=Natronolimnohabitans innermongolicus JCM 12255 TaxID=1227499 RepID=L9X2D2_9EURY|nr:HalOD1 output domain-containing protein [Natronolimnohabitans innermongolicus]ELY55919.1 hypothetical protein C493_10588 [Natronolimnohabitans innermongolicus JCM 12255]